MNTFAVIYTYDPTSPTIGEIRPVHREFLGALKDKGYLVGSGPFTDDEGGALIVIRLPEPATVTDAEKIMDNDPFTIQGAIKSRVIRPWNPVLNVFTD